ncbi:ATPase, T2SS/T4P/T4SS family [Vibrio sp. 10N.261.46.A3]|uniref:ATPase, T2SS/T4P/T4SS family n=1 Tax=Vibrio sp. 10N.261.46.A3 TaxID=3229658 RepID=UPI00354D0FCF
MTIANETSKPKSIMEAKLRPFLDVLNRDNIVEVCINKPTELFIETTTGEWLEEIHPSITEIAMDDLIQVCAARSGQDFNWENPIFSGRIPFGDTTLRVEAVKGSSVESRFAMSIRVGKPTVYPLTNWFADPNEAQVSIDAVKNHKTLMVCGATGTGKTTLLNSLIAHIPMSERIITVEDTQELIVPHKNKVPLLKSKHNTDAGGVGYDNLINSITRLRPDRVLMGEIDTNNIMPFLRICNTGHEGSLTTLHAADAEEAFDAMCLNVQLAGSTLSKEAVKDYARNAISGFIFVSRHVRNGQRKFTARLEML